MTDDLSPFDDRMRRPAVISIVGGMLLGFMAIYAQRILMGVDTPIVMGVVFGLLASAALFANSYRSISARLD